jgi:thiamine-monophosphate kinase
MNEPDFLAALKSLPLHPGARGLLDDCAVLGIGGETLVLTHDMMVEGTHFRPDADMADVVAGSDATFIAMHWRMAAGVVLLTPLAHDAK